MPPCEESLYPLSLMLLLLCSSLFFLSLDGLGILLPSPPSVVMASASSFSFFFSHRKLECLILPPSQHTAPLNQSRTRSSLYPGVLEWWRSSGSLGSSWRGVAPARVGLGPSKEILWSLSPCCRFLGYFVLILQMCEKFKFQFELLFMLSSALCRLIIH